MSWMDSWSRPSANSKVPAPLYLSNEHVPYCHSCGRVISSKKGASTPIASSKSKAASKQVQTPPKYCSARCRAHRPSPADRRIETHIAALLNNEPDSGIETTAAQSRVVKGDPRLVITCDEIEAAIFGSRFDPEKTAGRRKNRRPRARPENYEEWRSVDMVSDDEDDEDDEGGAGLGGDGGGSGGETVAGVRVRLPQDQSLVNFSVGGERGRQERIEESEVDAEKRRQGARRAEEREMVRRAARRVVVFGVSIPQPESMTGITGPSVKGKKGKGRKQRERDGDEDEETDTEPGTEAGVLMRKAEALMAGMVVEPSFAKGNWSIRWRE